MPLAEFVKARDALAKELRASGGTEAAKAVKALRKPSRLAWALNQVARHQSDVVEELLAAAADVRRAPTRKATEAWQREVGRVVKSSPEGVPRDELSQAVYAVAADDDAEALFRAGRLTEVPEPPGFGTFGGLSVVEDDGEIIDDSAERAALEKAVEEARRRATDASRRAVTAAEEAERLRDRADEADERARAVKKEADDAARDLADAERALNHGK